MNDGGSKIGAAASAFPFLPSAAAFEYMRSALVSSKTTASPAERQGAIVAASPSSRQKNHRDESGHRNKGLTRFIDDGRIEMESNIVERSIRPIALNRKNAIFAESDGGEFLPWACKHSGTQAHGLKHRLRLNRRAKRYAARLIVISGRLDRLTAPLQPQGENPAEHRPGGAEAPPCQHVGWPMHAQKDAANSDQHGEDDRQ